MLGFETTVALRFLREGRLQSVLIVVGVAAGVAVVAYISALIGGLQKSTLDKTLGAQAHVALSLPDARAAVAARLDALRATPAFGDVQPRAERSRSIANWAAIAERAAAQPGVVAVSPLVAGAALAQRGDVVRSVSVSGIDFARHDRIAGLARRLVDGRPGLAAGEAIVGVQLADDLGLRVGDRFALDAGAGRADDARVAATIDLGATDANRRIVFVPLRTAQTLFDVPGGATRIELALADVWQAEAVAGALGRAYPVKAESWQQTNAQLVSALNAQRVSTGIIRGVVMIVVVLGIASVLVVSVVQKQREIGILRAMGATRAQVLRVFLVQGAVVGLVGAVLGVALATLLVAAFTRFVKGSDGLPLFVITMPPALALQIAAVAWLAGIVAAIAPARRAAAMDPAQAIRL